MIKAGIKAKLFYYIKLNGIMKIFTINYSFTKMDRKKDTADFVMQNFSHLRSFPFTFLLILKKLNIEIII